VTRVAVYSCYYGAHEPLNHFAIAEADCDRFVVTDNPDVSVDGATTIVDDTMDLPPAIASPRYKLCTQGPLSDYDLTIYLDNRSALKPNAIQRLKEVEAPFSLFWHHQRDCVYREGKACRRNKVIDKKRLDRQIARYHQAGLPRNSGLFAEPSWFASALRVNWRILRTHGSNIFCTILNATRSRWDISHDGRSMNLASLMAILPTIHSCVGPKYQKQSAQLFALRSRIMPRRPRRAEQENTNAR